LHVRVTFVLLRISSIRRVEGQLLATLYTTCDMRRKIRTISILGFH
jgi:hypothetical protein